jgi:hypothetical protein
LQQAENQYNLAVQQISRVWCQNFNL